MSFEFFKIPIIFSSPGILNAGVRAQPADVRANLVLRGSGEVLLVSSLCVSMVSGQNAHTGYEVNMEKNSSTDGP